MEIDKIFASKVGNVSDLPEPFCSALRDKIGPPEALRLLVHVPALLTIDESSPKPVPPAVPQILVPASVLAITQDSWIIASEPEAGDVTVEKSSFNDTLFLELTSVLLYGRLKIDFASVGRSYSALTGFNTVTEELFRGAIGLILNSIEQREAPLARIDVADDSMLATWPGQFRIEAQRYRPEGRRLLAATQWPAIFDGFRRELSPAGALLVTERELVLISEEKMSPRLHRGDLQKFGGVITYFPLVRLADFRVSHHGRFGVLALQVHATHGGERLEIIFPVDQESAVSRALEQVSDSVRALRVSEPAQSK